MSISINTFKSCYIVGIGGSGMSSIAKYLFQKGLEVSGYDQRSSYVTNLLNNDGIKVDFDISNATYSSDTLYIVSSAINMESNFLSDFVKQPNVLTRPDFLKLLSASVDVIGITGTHGKHLQRHYLHICLNLMTSIYRIYTVVLHHLMG